VAILIKKLCMKKFIKISSSIILKHSTCEQRETSGLLIFQGLAFARKPHFLLNYTYFQHDDVLRGNVMSTSLKALQAAHRR
jgi:hypothetical protein